MRRAAPGMRRRPPALRTLDASGARPTEPLRRRPTRRHRTPPRWPALAPLPRRWAAEHRQGHGAFRTDQSEPADERPRRGRRGTDDSVAVLDRPQHRGRRCICTVQRCVWLRRQRGFVDPQMDPDAGRPEPPAHRRQVLRFRLRRQRREIDVAGVGVHGFVVEPIRRTAEHLQRVTPCVAQHAMLPRTHRLHAAIAANAVQRVAHGAGKPPTRRWCRAHARRRRAAAVGEAMADGWRRSHPPRWPSRRLLRALVRGRRPQRWPGFATQRAPGRQTARSPRHTAWRSPVGRARPARAGGPARPARIGNHGFRAGVAGLLQARRPSTRRPAPARGRDRSRPTSRAHSRWWRRRGSRSRESFPTSRPATARAAAPPHRRRQGSPDRVGRLQTR